MKTEDHFPGFRMKYIRAEVRISKRSPAKAGEAMHMSSSASLLVPSNSNLSPARTMYVAPSSLRQNTCPLYAQGEAVNCLPLGYFCGL